MKPKHILIVLVVALPVLAIAGYLLLCMLPARVAINCSSDADQRLVVKLKPNRQVNYIYAVCFRLEGSGSDQLLWKLAEGAQPLRRIVYGEIPDGAVQKIPPDGARPMPIPPGRTLRLRVDYQYDEPFAPSTGSTEISIRCAEDGAVSVVND